MTPILRTVSREDPIFMTREDTRYQAGFLGRRRAGLVQAVP